MDHQHPQLSADLVETEGIHLFFGKKIVFHGIEFDLVFLHQTQVVLDELVDEIIKETFDAGIVPLPVFGDRIDDAGNVAVVVDEDDAVFVEKEAEAVVIAIEIISIGYGKGTGQRIVVDFRSGDVLFEKVVGDIVFRIKVFPALQPFFAV